MRATASTALVACIVTGCTGSILDRGTGASGPAGQPAGAGDPVAPPAAPSSGGGATTAPPVASCSGTHPGPSPIRRLTREEYNRTVRDLLGDDTRPADAFPPEESGNGFGNDANALSVSRLLIDQYSAAAEAVAARATTDPQRFANLLGCDPARAGEDACARAFVQSFGEQAFRRPMTAADVGDLMMVYSSVRPTADFRAGVQAVLRTMLQSPEFLYRIEGGGGTPGVVPTTPYERASRLSYLLWGSMPDATLFAEARAGRLTTKEQVAAQAQRMLQDPRAKEMVRSFYLSLFGLGGLEHLQKDAAVFPKFTPDVAPLLKQEVQRFVDAVVWDGPGDVATFLTASYTFLNARLAKFYGVGGPTGDAFQRVDMDPTRRAGFLTQAGLMAALTPGNDSNPVVRGAFVRNQLFCTPPPSPPPSLNVREPSPDRTLTTRERFAAHRTDPVCAACHQLLDPVGLGFENYDAIGLWRSTENGKPVDASGEIVGTDVPGPFNGPIELARKLARSEDVQRCMGGKWASFAYGRGLTDEDRCTTAAVGSALLHGGVREMLLALTQTDAFLYRTVSP